MTDLKTLKDIEMFKCEDYSESNLVKENELRQEAIKHIKVLQETYDNSIESSKPIKYLGQKPSFLDKIPHITQLSIEDEDFEWRTKSKYLKQTIDFTIAYLKYFFNITEEELK